MPEWNKQFIYIEKGLYDDMVRELAELREKQSKLLTVAEANEYCRRAVERSTQVLERRINHLERRIPPDKDIYIEGLCLFCGQSHGDGSACPDLCIRSANDER